MFDFETLRILWWTILVFLVCGFAVLDGFDFGIGILLPFLGKSDYERRVMLNTVGPTWEGSQTWLVTLGGISFGAWSIVYASFFSGLYAGVLVLLFALFLRPVGFDYRSKIADPRWRNAWDWSLFVGGLVPAAVLSLAVGNLIIGLPFQLDGDLRSFYSGSFWDLFQPFTLLCAVIGVALFTLHGAVFLHWRTEGELADRALRVIRWSSPVFAIGFVLAGIWVGLGVDGYRIVSAVDPSVAANPLAKTVIRAPGLWLDNYRLYPGLIIAPLLALTGAWLVVILSSGRHHGVAFLVSGLTVIGAVVTAGGSMFPFMMPSSTHPRDSLTVWDASASEYTLQLLFAVTAVLMPIVLAYTIWVYRVLRGKVTVEQVRGNEHTMY
ncbi:cytochrome d ubiquinol oxidase subunit II [Methylomicrobium sp. Wu6]|uniref:cytochrome d ubiquinol oxidase subunit II n=1 Tax=Methylomicrobium sp. Wu6 TaxID=3107928 RepID=UPI002DD6719D|nr:cytochrome d ubiquinol oxidase subunit II [Methylomicrobium sp. Wu6]MEC4746997.1 cytochrome d ubiquinol oxidase subunit II [Methylomicrobium sp. Wu6]